MREREAKGARAQKRERARLLASPSPPLTPPSLPLSFSSQKLHADRLAALRTDAERRARTDDATDPTASGRRPGEVEDMREGELLAAAAAAPRLVAHFSHPAFTRCALLDRHLATLAAAHPTTRFVRVVAPDCPFLTAKLNVRVLPALLSFVGGACTGRCVGFDAYQPRRTPVASLGGTALPEFPGAGGSAARPDAFPTSAVEARLVEHGAILLADAARARAAAAAGADGCGDLAPPEHARRAVRKGSGGRGRGRGGRGGGSSGEESSDWSD